MSNPNDFIIENGMLKKYQGPGGDVVIPENVICIMNNAFRNCNSIITLTVLPGCTSIKPFAFHASEKLTKVILPGTVETIDSNAFSGCKNLKQIEFHCGLKLIGEHSFRGCCSLTEIVFPVGLEVIDYSAFYECDGLRKVIFPESVITVRSDAFSHCINLVDVYLPNSVESFGYGVFKDCPNIKFISGNQGLVEAIQNDSFRIENGVLMTYTGIGGDVVIPENVTRIHDYAFSWCKGISSIRLPGSIQKVGKTPLSSTSCSVYVDEWTSVATQFIKDAPIKAIYTEDIDLVPAKYRPLAAIGFVSEKNRDMESEQSKKYVEYLKKNAGKLASLACDNPNLLYFLCDYKMICAKDIDAYMAEADKCDDVEVKSLLLEYQNSLGVDKVAKAREKKVKLKENFSNALEERMAAQDPSRGIEGMTFVVTGKLSTWPKVWNSRAEIQDYLEQYGAHLGGSVTKKTDYLVTNDMDSGSEKNKKAKEYGALVISEAEFNEMIGRHYKDAPRVIIPTWLTTIPEEAFKFCESMTEVTIPSSVKSIGRSAFEGCTSLQKLTIPTGVEHIAEGAFKGCTNLEIIDMPETVTSIGMCGTFGRCSALKNLTIPKSVKEIGYTNIGRFTGPKTYHANTIGPFSFDSCTNLKEFIIPDGVECIDRAFYDCTNLEQIRIPGSVKSIIFPFERCPKLTIHAPVGSYAEQYAKENNIPFVAE